MITIGPAREPERAVVARLLAEAGLPVDGLEHTWLLVARDDPAEAAAGKPTGEGEVVGAVGLEAHPPAGVLRSLVVAPAYRGAGTGTALVARLLEAADARGVSDLWLLTTTAAPFFARLGFEPADRASAPPGVRDSIEFRAACPTTAACLRLALT
ncbi:MAG TPA: GNAT family N-acetyltransferase [Thermodesulfobacteriota bacterium]